jgi:hypothetical protein
VGTVLAQNIVNRVSRELKDPNNVRWPVEQMLDWLNDAQREICILKPDAYVVTASMVCAVGTQQTLPVGGRFLIDVIRNMGSGSAPGSAIRVVERETLDQLKPSWQSGNSGNAVQNYVYDRRAPNVFYVYPGVGATVHVLIQYAGTPPDATIESVNSAVVSTPIAIDDIYVTGINDYLQMRAYGKDTDARDEARSSAAYMRFLNRLGMNVQAERKAEANTNAPPKEPKREGDPSGRGTY